MIALGMRAVGFAVNLVAIPHAMWLVPLSLFLIGGSLACTFIVAPSIKSDVIDYDELVTGDRKEGSYFAIWNLVQSRKGLMQSATHRARLTRYAPLSKCFLTAIFPICWSRPPRFCCSPG